MHNAWLNLAYLVASMMFIVAFKLLAHPRTATRGNLIGSAGMALAIIAAFFEPTVVEARTGHGFGSSAAILIALAIGSAVGGYIAVKAPMTAMPQMVALLNGFGGAASTLVAGAELHGALHNNHAPDAYGQTIIA